MCGPLSQSSQRQLFGIVLVERLCLLINGPMWGVEDGFQTTSDTMLCSEQKRHNVHVECLFSTPCTSSLGNAELSNASNTTMVM